MRQNHIPRAERLKQRIYKLSYREDGMWVKSSRGNPYLKCRDCGIHQPSFYCQGGYRHFKWCSYQGIDKQIAYYKRLLAEEASS